MNIMVVGSGAREHAVIQAFARSAHKPELYCFAKQTNPGIKELCAGYQVGDILNPQAVSTYAKQIDAKLVFIGPEEPLAAGVADVLWAAHIAVVGPVMQLAAIETSKSFARDLMTEFAIPGCPRYKRFTDLNGVETFLHSMQNQYVIKADGLMGGKGVKVSGEHCHNLEEAMTYCQQLLALPQAFVIEEKCLGQEFSLMSYSDGEHLSHMPVVQDHKRAFVGDTGPNTGGMGSYSCADHRLPFISQDDVVQAQAINERIVHALHDKYQQPYIGVLYGGFMATKTGVKVIEYNARFGDPEAINVLSLLQTDFVDLCVAMTEQRLDELTVNYQAQATVCKYAVPNGYPDQPVKDQAIDVSQVSDSQAIYLAAVDERDGELIATGSRAIAVLGVALTLADAQQQAEAAVQQIQGPLFHRADIGTQALINQRIVHMNNIRDEQIPLL